MRSRWLVLVLLVSSCIAPSVGRRSDTSGLDGYARALEQAVARYEVEVRQSPRGLPSGRYEVILTAALQRRGLTLEGFHALGRTEPRFYFTQQALYAVRLDEADAVARARRPVELARPE